MQEPSEDEIGDAMARFTELSEVMPGGLTSVVDAGTLARIVNALPPDTEVMFDDVVRGAPQWWQGPDPVSVGVAQLSWILATELVTEKEAAVQPELAGRDHIRGFLPALILGRRILRQDGDDLTSATELAYAADRAQHALEVGDIDVFVAELASVLEQWANRLATDAADEAPAWLESQPRHEDAITADPDFDDQDGPDTPVGRLRAEERDLLGGLHDSAARLREAAAALTQLCPPREQDGPQT